MKIVVLLALLVFSACQPQKNESESQTTETASNSKQVIAKPTVASEFLISANGIGKAKLGITLSELKQISARNTKFEVVTPFMVNINAIAVSQIRFKAFYFKLISEGLGFLGIYPEYPGVSYTTDKYLDGAAISAIEVSCLSHLALLI